MHVYSLYINITKIIYKWHIFSEVCGWNPMDTGSKAAGAWS